MQNQQRDINGFFLLDKPLMLSSNQALQKVKRLLQAKKAGHTGSLDPLASGLLPLAFGEATKFSQYLLMADKTYAVIAQLGASSTTGDEEGGKTLSGITPNISDQTLQQLEQQFLGAQWQTPPMYSALKQQGKPLYQLARQGITVERAPRHITIHAFSDWFYDTTKQQLHFTTQCSKGTYIRSLVEDIGNYLGCGAYVTTLRRTAISGLPNIMCPLLSDPDLSKNIDNDHHWKTFLLPPDYAVLHFPEMTLDEDQTRDLQQGKFITLSEIIMNDGLHRIYNQNHYFLGIGEVEQSILKPKRLTHLNMQP